MKFVINPKAKKILIGFFALALLATIFLSFHPAILPRHVISDAGSEPDAQAAIDSVTAFYTLDYTLSPELWISSVCAFSTEQGCNTVRSYFAPAIESQVQKYRIQTGCAVTPIQLVANQGNIRIWQVKVTLDHPWSGLNASTQTVYVEVVKAHDKWLMNRILFNQETGTFSTPAQ